jgi:hypothetical protein
LALIVALAVVLLTKGGSSAQNAATSSSVAQPGVTTTTATKHHPATKPSAKKAKATPAAETSVVVLNGTETPGLAHRLSTQLQQNGYSQATALFNRPPGADEATVVEYASGHQADAAGVARSLSVSHVVPMEQAIAQLAGSAKVVVVAGADKATTP